MSLVRQAWTTPEARRELPNHPHDPLKTGASQETSTTFATAVAAHKSGRLSDAESGYRLVIQQHPQESEAYHLLGMVMMATDRPQDAVISLTECVRINPKHVGALNALGAAQSLLQDHKEASDTFRRAANVSPNDPKTWFNLGRALSGLLNYEEALQAFKKAVELSPRYWKAVSGYGHCLLELGRAQDAVSPLRDSARGDPSEKAFHYNLVRALLESGELGEAATECRTAIETWPKAPELRFLMASVLQQSGAEDDAISCLREAVESDPNSALCLNELANLLYAAGRWKEAEVYAMRVLELEPESVNAMTNLGRIRQMRGDLNGALAHYKGAIELEPDYGDAHNNLGNLLMYMDQFEDAIHELDIAVKAKPEKTGFLFNRATAHMTSGNIANVWRDFRCRSEKESYNDRSPHLPWPLWDGEDLTGKRILGWADQGMGDQILTSRFFYQATRGAAHAVFECSPRLTSLFQRSFEGALPVVPENTPIDHVLATDSFDFQAAALDVCCSQFKTLDDIPPAAPLIADKAKAAELRSKYLRRSEGRPLIGISWVSGGTHIAHFKSTDLTEWGAILSNKDVAFVDLQYGNLKDEIAAAEKKFDLSIITDPDIDARGDLDPFAAQVEAMDLVITISNTTAHLAGALAKRTLTMTPTGPGRLWYWFVDGSTTPWYSNMTLFRHSYDEGWSKVIESVGEALANAVPSLLENQ